MAGIVKYGFKAADIVAANRITQREIDELQAQLKEYDVPTLNMEQCVLFLLSCDRDIKFTLKTIQEYYKAKCGGPELFDNRSLEISDIQYQLGVM